MTTFTLRAAASLTERLSSADVRSWLEDFVRDPRLLPPDPGSGPGRVSLTLPKDVVSAVANYLHCTRSSAIRRVAFERIKNLDTTNGQNARLWQVGSNDGISNVGTHRRPDDATGALMALMVISFFCVLMYFVRSRAKDHDKKPQDEIGEALAAGH